MFALLSQKNGFAFVNQIWHFKALSQYSVANKIRFRLLTAFKTNLQETQIQGESSSESFKGCLIYLEKWFCIYLESLAFSCRVPKFICSEDSIYTFGRTENKCTGNSNIKNFFFSGKFQGQPRSPRKVVLCSLTKFGILRPCTNIHSLKSFDVGFYLHFRGMRVTVSVSCITEQRLRIQSLMEQRNANHTFTAGSGVVLFDI